MCQLIRQLQACEGNSNLENCAPLGYYAAGSGNSLTTFRDELSIPSSMVKMGPISRPETSVRNYRYSLRNSPEGRSSHLLRGGSLKTQTIIFLWHLHSLFQISHKNSTLDQAVSV